MWIEFAWVASMAMCFLWGRYVGAGQVLNELARQKRGT